MDIGFLLLAGSLPVARRRPLGRSMLLSSLFVRSLPSARRRFRWCCCDNPVIQNQFGRSPVLILNSLDWLSITTSLHLLLSSPSASTQHSSLESTASTGGYAEYAALELLGNVYEIPKHFHRIIRKLSALSILNVSSCYFMCWKMRVIHSAMSGWNVSECIVVIETCTGRFRGRIIY